MYLGNILENELDRNSVCKDFLHTASDGKKCHIVSYIAFL